MQFKVLCTSGTMPKHNYKTKLKHCISSHYLAFYSSSLAVVGIHFNVLQFPYFILQKFDSKKLQKPDLFGAQIVKHFD